VTSNKSEKKLLFTLLCLLFVPATAYSALFVPVQSILTNNVEYEYSALTVAWNQLTYLPDLIMRLGAAVCLAAAVRTEYGRRGFLYVWCLAASLFRLLSATLVGGLMEGGFDVSDFGYNVLIFILSWLVDVLYLGAVALFAKKKGNAWAIAVAAVLFGVKIISALTYDIQIGMPTDTSEWFAVVMMYVSLLACGILAALCLPHLLQRTLNRLAAVSEE